MKRIFLAAVASLALAAPANAQLWTGNGTTETRTDRFTGSVTTTYDAKRGECGISRSNKAAISACTDITTDGDRSILLYSTSQGWEVMYYRNSSNNKANVILVHKNGKKENTVLPAVWHGSTIRGGLVMETVIVKNVPASVVSLEVQYGAIEYWYKPNSNRSSISPAQRQAQKEFNQFHKANNNRI